jgi:putative N6-adenine-specific DNA methylase
MAARLPLFATTSRGTEQLLAEELTELGAAKVKQDRGGVRFHANLREALRIVLHSRLAMRVLYPLLEAEAKGAEGLYDAVKSVAWEDHFTLKSTFAVEATLKDSEHNHSGFVALKVKDAIVDRLRDKLGGRPDVETADPDLKIVAHLAKTKLSLSLDLCGEALNRRGYRVAQTAAPLKETLAAAMLRAAKYTGDEPFADPMCGSGTIVIEAALIAMRRAPGIHRTFGVERWPQMMSEASAILTELRAEAKGQERVPPFPLFARDREEEAIDATKRNIKAARLGMAVLVEQMDAMFAPPPDGPAGLLVSNPPYGDWLNAGGQKGMKSFYFKLGDSLGAWHWRMAILCGNPAFESAFHHRPSEERELWNGPIECRLLVYPGRKGVPPA